MTVKALFTHEKCITQGYLYQVVQECELTYLIRDNNNQFTGLPKRYFEVVK